MKLSDFYLDEEKLEQGAKVPLAGPDGRETGEWLRVLYMHSDAAQAAIAEEYKRLFHDEAYDPEKPINPKEVVRNIRHVLVSGWSFDEPCTPEKVRELFRLNPAIANNVVYKSEQKRLFFPEPAESSSGGRKKS